MSAFGVKADIEHPDRHWYSRCMRSFFSKTWFRVAAGITIAVTILIAVNWPTVTLLSAIASSERRPALLNDASWNDPASAVRFHRRFGENTSEEELAGWLKQNRFEIDHAAHIAKKRVYGLPCNEYIDVTWSSSEDHSIAELEAIISGGGCL